MINQRCLACDRFRDACNGGPGDCVRHTRIDFNRTAPCNSISNIASSILTETVVPPETRQQKFGRIGTKRREQALEAIRKLEHLTSHYDRKRSGVTSYTYEWTKQQAVDLIMPIEEALENLKRELLVAPLNREHGLITEEKE